MDRRHVVLGLGAAVVASLAGCLGRFEDDPTEAAEEFVELLNEGEFAAVDELIHPDSPLDGSGQAAALVGGHYGVDDLVEEFEFAIDDSTVVDESGDEATVEVTIFADIVVDVVERELPLEMRQNGGDWLVWTVAT